ncbi:hypothetical protein HAX54_047264, partial [Datura stramonium]|nr:hypothetical protein [Datura stramonium]
MRPSVLNNFALGWYGRLLCVLQGEEGPFTIHVGPYFPELVWEFYASYRVKQSILKNKGQVDTMPCLSLRVGAGQEVNITPESGIIGWLLPKPPLLVMCLYIARYQPQRATSKGMIHCHDLKFEARMWLDLTHINVGEIIVEQFNRK